MTVEPALQNQLGQQCGDRFLPSKHGAAGLLTLDYPCALTANAAVIAAAVRALRADENIIRALRLRNVQVAGRLGDLRLTIDTLGLNGLFPDQEVAP